MPIPMAIEAQNRRLATLRDRMSCISVDRRTRSLEEKRLKSEPYDRRDLLEVTHGILPTVSLI
jgi:hypothetical protein